MFDCLGSIDCGNKLCFGGANGNSSLQLSFLGYGSSPKDNDVTSYGPSCFCFLHVFVSVAYAASAKATDSARSYLGKQW